MRTHVNSVGLLVCSDPALSFSPPAHIPRHCIDALPPQPGIYIFRDAAGSAIYIGKSVNIRNRVLSHLRTPDEAQMLARTAHIDFERSGGEIGALLREAQLIRREQPVFNQKLRRLRDMCAISLAGALPQIVFACDMDFAVTDDLYGLFASRKGALEALRDLAQAHALCLVCTGLEKTTPGRPCFGRQIGRCRGACVGEETAADHAARLQAALLSLRIVRWPYAGPIAIVEESEGLRQRQLVHRWCYLGTTMSKRAQSEARFDMDVYQILARPLLAGQLTVEEL
jgi:excinuclease Cho